MHRILIIALLVLLLGCETGSRDDNKGQITLSSAFDFTSATIHGYHFELGTFSPFPPVDGPVPDIILDKFTRVNGDILPGFNSPENNHGFALISQSGGLAESVSYFEEYQEFDTSMALSPSTDTLEKYQLWVLKTNQDNYVKINIRDIRILNNVAGDYIELSLDYHYQDDGTPVFPK